jgi:hypothetical protein
LNQILREGEMLQILAPTKFRAAAVNPDTPVTTLQAYSLLFGKYEIATEGDFGLFVVNAIGAAAPPGGWTKQGALDYLKTEFGIESGYGWNASAPLCAEVFDNSLRQILLRLHPTSAPAKPPLSGGLRNSARRVQAMSVIPLGDDDGMQATGVSQASQARGQTTANNREVEELIRQVRSGGLIPSDRCALIPARGLIQLNPEPIPPGPPRPPASSSVPPPQQATPPET